MLDSLDTPDILAEASAQQSACELSYYVHALQAIYTYIYTL